MSKKEKIFDICSIVFILTIGIYFSYRFIYYYNDNNKEHTYSNNLSIYLTTEKNRYTLNTSIKNIDNTQTYIGDVNNNYIKFGGYLFRILRVNADMTTTIVSEDTIYLTSYNNIDTWLNKTTDKTGIFENTINKDYLVNTKNCDNTIDDLKNITCNNKEYKIGILSLKDYIESGNNTYLNNNTSYWLSNSYNESNNWYITSDGKIANANKDTKLGVRPVITLNKNTKIVKGIGTYEDPYIIEDREVSTTKDILVGEFIKYNNEIWRVVNHDNTLKIASVECLKKNEECITYNYSNVDNNIKNSNLHSYLNNIYFNSLPNKEYLIKDTIYIGNYSLLTNNYKDIYKTSIESYVASISISDMYYNEVKNVYLTNPSTTNDLSIYSINNDNNLYENMITNRINIRPTLFIKNNIEIKGGNGTYNKPYILGGLR